METLAIAAFIVFCLAVVGAVYLAFTEPPDWYTYR